MVPRSIEEIGKIQNVISVIKGEIVNIMIMVPMMVAKEVIIIVKL